MFLPLRVIVSTVLIFPRWTRREISYTISSKGSSFDIPRWRGRAMSLYYASKSFSFWFSPGEQEEKILYTMSCKHFSFWFFPGEDEEQWFILSFLKFFVLIPPPPPPPPPVTGREIFNTKFLKVFRFDFPPVRRKRSLFILSLLNIFRFDFFLLKRKRNFFMSCLLNGFLFCFEPPTPTEKCLYTKSSKRFFFVLIFPRWRGRKISLYFVF